MRVTFNEPEPEVWKKTVRELRERGRHRLLKIVQQEFGGLYELDFVSVSDGLIELHVAAYPPKSSAFVVGRTANRGEDCELWILRADRATELIRRWLKSELLRHNEKKEILVHAEWVPGIGVDVAGGPETDPSARGLQGKLDSLRREQRFLRDRLQSLVVIGILCFFTTSGLALAARLLDQSTLWLGAGYVALLAVASLLGAARLVTSLRYLRMESEAFEEALDLGGLLDEEEKRAHKLFQINSAEVRRYYDQALRQRRYIFYLGVLCILLGFGSVFIAFSLIGRNPASPLEEKVVIAILGTVSGILANFVALIFLNMFSAIVKSMVNFHQRLVSTHHVVFSNVLVAKIQSQKLRDDTLAHVALALSKVTVSEGRLDSGELDSGEEEGDSSRIHTGKH